MKPSIATLYYDPRQIRDFDSEADALAFARSMKLESFEIRDSDDQQVFLEFPKAVWS